MLKVNYAGIPMENPVIVASGTPSLSYELLKRAEAAGAGAVVPKSVIYSKPWLPFLTWPEGKRTGPNPRPRFNIINNDIKYDYSIGVRGGYYSMINSWEPYILPEEFAGWMEKAHHEIKMPIIGSICAAPRDYEEWARLAKFIEETGVAGIELNMHHMPPENFTDPEIIKAVKETVKIPVMPKLMVPHENPSVVIPKVVEAGADSIVVIGNQPLRGVEVDVDNEDYVFANTVSSFRGPWFRPMGLAWTLQTARLTDKPISGVSGVATWRDVVKYILLGATTVQVCTAIYVEGFRIIQQMVDGLENWMKEHGYNSIEEFRGKLVPQFIELWTRDEEPPIKVIVNRDLCTDCGLCAEVCFFEAIKVDDKGHTNFCTDTCDGCGLCPNICPVQALRLEPVPA